MFLNIINGRYKVIFVDVDETICHYGNPGVKRTEAVDYSTAIPFKDRIEKINKLFDEGKTIVYWTARGTRTGINWFQVTLKQLNDWGCKFTELRLGKHIMIVIDDKNIHSKNF